jgi:APA family basic amino acid/polyamine antiporter
MNVQHATDDRNTLSVADAAIVVVGIVFGSGIFVAPQAIAAFTGSAPLALLAWPMGALIALCGSFCYAECISRLRATGGFYSVFQQTFGEPVAATAGVLSQVLISPAALAGPATIGGHALCTLVYGDTRYGLPASLLLLVLAGLLNVRGVHFSSVMQRLFVAAKITLVAALLLACLLRAGQGAPAAAATAQALPVAAGARELAQWAPFFGILMWAFDGWTDVTLIAPQLRRPGRDLPRALLVGLLALAGIFVAVQAAIMSILGVAGTAAAAQPFAEAIAHVFGPSSRVWVDAAIVVSTFTSAHGVMWMVSSLTRVMSDQGSMPRVLGRRDAAWGMPISCVGFVVVMAGCVCLLDDFSAIVSLFSFFIWVFYGMMALALMGLRRRGTAPEGTWTAPGGLMPPLIVLAVALLMTLGHVLAFPRACLLATLLFAGTYAAHRLLGGPGGGAGPGAGVGAGTDAAVGAGTGVRP